VPVTVASRSRRWAIAAAATLAALVALAGCTESRPTAEPDASPATATTPDASGPARSDDPAPTPATAAPSPGSMAVPDTTSGALSRTSFPTPRELGAGWTYSVDPGDAEEGYAGNGTPALERSPEEITRTAVPLGCDRPTPMPRPTHALEVDYAFRGAKVIAVRGQFRDPATAREFFTGRSQNLRGCLRRSGSVAIGPLVAGLTSPARDAVASDRTPASDPWHELAVLDRATVALVAVQGADRLTDAQTRRLVTLLRG
jgi:hypothetical protein